MTQYIPKDALLAEIVKKIEKYTKRAEETDVKCDSDSMYWSGVLSCLTEVTSLLYTIEAKNVDLEEEFNDFIDNVEGVPPMWHSDEQVEWAKDIARHFFELGLKARKEEVK